MLADHTLDGGAHTDKITFPKLVLPKYDGIRVYIQGGRAYNRSGKFVPNSWLHTQLAHLPDGIEGEVVVNNNFADTTSALRSFDKSHYDFTFYMFDIVDSTKTYSERYEYLEDLLEFVSDDVTISDLDTVNNIDELLKLESDYVGLGFEGVILRDPDAKYKHGRSTFKEQSYLSFKRFMTDTATIIGFKCKLEDGGEVDTLGALELDYNGVTFWCGSGLDDVTRSLLWAKQDELIGKSVEFKFQKSSQTAPRFPVFMRLV
jgi:DNA ligase-1